MGDSLLFQLNATPEQAADLATSARSRLLYFLLRWEAYQDALDCVLACEDRALVSLQDFQARALEGLRRYPEAIAVMAARLRQKESVTARNQLARLYLAAEQMDDALTIATAQTTGAEMSGLSWSLLGDVQLARGDLAAAEQAYLRHQELAPNSHHPQLGLMRIHHRRGNPITAAAYASRAFTVAEGEYELPIFALRELRDFFATTGDDNHQRLAEEQLTQRFAAELAEMQALVADGGEQRAARTPRPTASERTRSSPPPRPAATPLVTDLTTIPVSEAERNELCLAAQRLFAFDNLRPAQVEIMACARRGEHVLTILPTGAGKSLCYQLPAFLDEGVTLVVSPLIALMKDQVDNLPPALQAQAIALNSTLDGSQLENAVRDLMAGRYKLVYAAPERLRQRPFLHALQRAGLRRLVIDEAHCVSAWGHDFRPDYLYLAQAHQELGAPPILALTATAPLRVRQDIERQLFRLQEAAQPGRLRLIATDIYRPNLQLHVIKANEDAKLRHLLELCSALPGSGIVYVRSRQASEELAALLVRHNISAEHYHAGIANRAAVQERFMGGTTRVIVATVAFGMGVDKPDIRFILHYGLPDSVEAYYQEVGRAGRDGQPATCVLLYGSGDKGTLTRHANEDILTKEYLRTVYSTVRTRMAGQTTAALALDDLQRDLKAADDTQVRVALSVLEQVGLVTRHFDVPRTVTLQTQPALPDAAFAAFVDQARLRPQQKVDRNYLELATAVQIAPEQLEAQLLAWQDLGWLFCRMSGRNLLLSLRPAPEQVAQTIDSLLDQFATIQRQRVTEIADYARDHHCRHGYLANYLGGLARQACGACDNCAAPALPASALPLPDENDQRRLILTTLSKQSWGRMNLVNLLRGDAAVGDRGRSSPAFGALTFRSETALGQMIDELTVAGSLRQVTLTNGGVALELTPQGRELQRAGGEERGTR